jgi:methylated-DNA-[protein]-cysteine S-methyltransferase
LRVKLSRPEVPTSPAAATSFQGLERSTCSEIDAVLEQIQAFLEGVSVRFSLGMVRLDLCTEFQQSVLVAEYGIPRGQVSTYQLIGRFLGKPFAARAVGTALANNPFPIIIPCHRAIRSDGTLGGYQGGLSMKRALLEMEGISFDGAGRVVTENLFYATAGEGATPLLNIMH